MISLTGLNAPQREAAATVEGPLLILAGAGSGKTRTVTYRIANMVSNLGIPPEKILAVSFTNKAAKEMEERVVSLLGRANMRGMVLSTFHALSVKILKQDISKLNYSKNFTIYDTSDQMAIVREALQHFKSGKAYDRKVVLGKIGKLKNNGIGPSEFTQSKFFDPDNPYDDVTEYVYRFYQEKLRFYNAIDFDDILFLTVRLFHDHPEVARKYSEQFRYIMIDEYQDTNPLQFQIVLGLTSCHNNLCVVGDDDQSIYAFRGADIANILGFEKQFPGAKIVRLEENYRSTTEITSLANDVIRENKNRKDKTMFSSKSGGPIPLLWAMGDTDHEAAVVGEAIQEFRKKGGALEDVAVLYRSNTQAPPIEDALRMAQIPYQVIGGQKFYDKKEVKDLIAYLAVIHNPRDEVSLRRILNIPHRGIGIVTLDKYVARAQDLRCSVFDAMAKDPDLDPKRGAHIRSFTELIQRYRERMRQGNIQQAIQTLIQDIEYPSFIDKSYDNPKHAEMRKNDVMMFVEAARRFEMAFGGNATLDVFLERMLLQDSQDKEDGEEGKIKKNEVTLMTLHSSKGLEFKTVYLIGMEEEFLPHKRSVDESADISEERRLCYVGMTRAKETLVMTYCKERKLYGKMMPRLKSRFVLPLIGTRIQEQDRTTFGHLSVDEAEQYKKNFFENLLKDLGDE